MSSFNDALNRLEESGGDPWKPKKAGERLAIRVKRIEKRTVNTTNGPASAIVLSGTDEKDAVRDVWCWHTVLRNEVVNAAPQPGDVIAIEHLGKITPAGGGNPYVGYKVRRADDSTGGAFDWKAESTAGPPSPAAYEDAVPDAVEPAAAEPEDDIPF